MDSSTFTVVNDISFDFKIDTGTEVTVIPETIFKNP